MKSLKRVLCLVLCLAMVFSTVAFAGAENTAVASDEVTGFTQEDMLKTSGTKIVNQKGEKIQLKGVNLGGWLIFEDWLCPYEGATDHYSVIEILTERFGVEKAYELLDTYYDNWITEYDLDQIKSMGFNCVRVPFWYRNFYYDDTKESKILDENGEWDFSRLEWVVEECSKREIYVVLDMHGAPGFQSDAPHNGKGGGCGLYEDTAEGEYYREMTDELWSAIAAKFNGNPAVAMYDLLNEPMCDVDCTEITRRINNESIYTRLYNTVRAVDSDHIITMEAIWTALALPHPEIKGWKNVVYQVHFYQNSDFIFTLFCLLTRIYFPTVPMMMGEFYPHQRTTWSNCFKTMDNLNYSWFLWTYKASGHGMWDSDWCLYGAKDGFWNAKLETGDEEQILEAWSAERLNTQTGFQDTGHYDRDVASYLK